MKLPGVRPLLILSVVLLSACGGGADFEDLKVYMTDVKAKPKGHIEPIPTFSPYKAFSYGATALRGPFSKPVAVQEITRLAPSSNVKPDPNRSKQFLERFGLDTLAMVGTLEQSGLVWVIIDDGSGGIHRVKQGDYLGRNHGRIIEVSESYVAVVEIVPNGLDGWVERPRSLKMRDSE